MALETIVGEDCEMCYSCVLTCPQVGREIKDYIVDEVVVEAIPQSRVLREWDSYFMVIVVFIIGLILGLFLAT